MLDELVRKLLAIRTARREAGFTLAEVLLATFITSIVMAAIYGALMATLEARDKLDEARRRNQIGPAILGQIESDIRSLYPYQILDDLVLRGVPHTENGEPASQISLIANTPAKILRQIDDRPVPSHLVEIGYYLKVNPLDTDLLELWRAEGFYPDEEPLAPRSGATSFVKLHDRVKSFLVEYFIDVGENAEPIELWPPPPTLDRRQGPPPVLPRVIRITLVLLTEPKPTDAQGNLRYLSAEEEERRTRRYTRTIHLGPELSWTTMVLPAVPDYSGSGDDNENENENEEGGPGGGGGEGGGDGGTDDGDQSPFGGLGNDAGSGGGPGNPTPSLGGPFTGGGSGGRGRAGGGNSTMRGIR